MDSSSLADDLRKLLEQTNFIVGRLTAGNNALRSDLLELEVALALAKHCVHKKSSELEDELWTKCNETSTRMQTCVDLQRRIEGEIRSRSEELRQIENSLPAGTDVHSHASGVKRKTVVEFDMAGYTAVARCLESNLEIAAVATLNQEIAEFSDAALRKINIPRRFAFVSGGGDGAILAFDQAPTVFEYAEQFFANEVRHNARVTDPALATVFRRYFRMGAATGDIGWEARSDGLFDAAGGRIIDAVRFQAAGRPGELFVDETTFRALRPEQRDRFEREPVLIKGKLSEVFTVYHCIFDPQAAEEAVRLGIWHPKS